MGGARTRARIATVLAAALVAAEALAMGFSGHRAAAVPAALRAPTTLATRVREAAPEASTPAERPAPYLLVRIERATALTARPGGGRVVGAMPRSSRYYETPHVAWVLEVSPDGRYGRVPIPYDPSGSTGWLPIRGLETSRTRVRVVADLSRHAIVVRRGDRVLLRAPAATGAPSSPTPTGRYFVTDRVPFAGGGVLGTFAFGLSGIQPRLPAGWTGGDQLAIHGTNAPSTIGRPASAGCLRVSERVLERLKPLLRLGTPVVVRP